MRDELRGPALVQFFLSRSIGSASFVTGAWLQVRVLDHRHHLRHGAVRVVARIAAVLPWCTQGQSAGTRCREDVMFSTGSPVTSTCGLPNKGLRSLMTYSVPASAPGRPE